MPDQPTRQWFEDQIKACEQAIVANNVVAAFCKQMIEKGIFVEGQKDVSDAPTN